MQTSFSLNYTKVEEINWRKKFICKKLLPKSFEQLFVAGDKDIHWNNIREINIDNRKYIKEIVLVDGEYYLASLVQGG